MKKYKIIYTNGVTKIIKAKNTLEIIKKYNLCTKENVGATVNQIKRKK